MFRKVALRWRGRLEAPPSFPSESAPTRRCHLGRRGLTEFPALRAAGRDTRMHDFDYTRAEQRRMASRHEARDLRGGAHGDDCSDRGAYAVAQPRRAEDFPSTQLHTTMSKTRPYWLRAIFGR